MVGPHPAGNPVAFELRAFFGEGPSAFCNEIRRPLLVASQVFLVGTRALDAAEHKYISESDIPILLDLEKTSVVYLEERIRKAGFRQIYIHIDVDVLDPENFSGALMPTSGAARSR